MILNKNEKIILDIIDINNDGLGIAKIFDAENNKNIVFFVKDAILGDKVECIITKVANNVIFAKTINIIKKSQYRVEPKCKVHNVCGGCQLLSLDYNKQLEIKKELVKKNLINIGKISLDTFDKINFDIIANKNPYHFRNKIIVPFGIRNDDIICGYYAGRTHYIIDNSSCETAFLGHNILIKITKDILKKMNISIYDEKNHKGVFRQLMMRIGNESKEISISFVINDKDYKNNIDIYNKLSNLFLEELKNVDININIVSINLNINTSNNNVLLTDTNYNLYGRDYIKDTMTLQINNDKYVLNFNISPTSFYQINITMTKVLYETALEMANIKKDDEVLDFYCGIGTISLFCAKLAKSVVGVEVVDKAIENAKSNSILNNIENAKFICRDLENDILLDDEADRLKKTYDVLILDPPRKGLSESVINYILKYLPKKILYVSCDSATLSRDLHIILDKSNYRIDNIKIVDMFSHTMHVETVVLLSKVNN